jgi:hypothetical protein
VITHRLPIALVMGLSACAAPVAASRADAHRAFERFVALEGEWEGKSSQGWTDRVRFQKIARGSAVLETSLFEAHPGETMLTIAHPDGDRLLLTHYCVAKNQPRLVLSACSEDGKELDFEFLDATNLASRNRGHMDRAEYRFLDDDHFTSRWTWYQDGQETWMETIEFRRLASPQAVSFVDETTYSAMRSRSTSTPSPSPEITAPAPPRPRSIASLTSAFNRIFP